MSTSKPVTYLRRRLKKLAPSVAIVLGSSLGRVADIVADPIAIPYARIPGFPRPGVAGHAGLLLAGRIGASDAIVLNGRVHPYERGDAAAMRPVIEALAALHVRAVILLNAAGSLMPGIGPGRLMLITDHINFTGLNPLTGDRGSDRFVSMTGAYDEKLADRLRAAARSEAIDLVEGTYVWFSGPSFETPAEIRAARTLGADAVGMSTVPEVILARRFGLRVAAVSAITNLAAGISGSSPSHEETLREGGRCAADVARLLSSALEQPIDG